jgi:hypothetical protein
VAAAVFAAAIVSAALIEVISDCATTVFWDPIMTIANAIANAATPITPNLFDIRVTLHSMLHLVLLGIIKRISKRPGIALG